VALVLTIRARIISLNSPARILEGCSGITLLRIIPIHGVEK
jgi:hypothetical protein